MLCHDGRCRGDLDALTKLLDRLLGKPVRQTITATGTLQEFLSQIAAQEGGASSGTTTLSSQDPRDRHPGVLMINLTPEQEAVLRHGRAFTILRREMFEDRPLRAARYSPRCSIGR